MRVAAGVLDREDFGRHPLVVAREEGAAVDDHVDLVRARVDGQTRVVELRGEWHEPGGEAARDGGDQDAAPRERVLRDLDQVRIDADGRHVRHGRVARERAHRLLAELADLSFGVLTLEGRQVEHRDRELDPGDLRGLLDRAFGERRGAFVDPDRVHAGDAGRIEGARERAHRTLDYRTGLRLLR